jgi:hypothetical protein
MNKYEIVMNSGMIHIIEAALNFNEFKNLMYDKKTIIWNNCTLIINPVYIESIKQIKD